MTTFICFAIAMTILCFMKVLTGGFHTMDEILTFVLMMVLLGGHVYLSTRKKAVYGSVVPILVVISFYPVYKLTAPAGAAVFILVGLYVITLAGFLAIWYKARKNV